MPRSGSAAPGRTSRRVRTPASRRAVRTTWAASGSASAGSTSTASLPSGTARLGSAAIDCGRGHTGGEPSAAWGMGAPGDMPVGASAEEAPEVPVAAPGALPAAGAAAGSFAGGTGAVGHPNDSGCAAIAPPPSSVPMTATATAVVRFLPLSCTEPPRRESSPARTDEPEPTTRAAGVSMREGDLTGIRQECTPLDWVWLRYSSGCCMGTSDDPHEGVPS